MEQEAEQKIDRASFLPLELPVDLKLDTDNVVPFNLIYSLTNVNYDDESLYSDLPKSKFSSFEHFEKFEELETIQQKGITNFLPLPLTIKKEELNSYNYRSEEFINYHENKHILFAGDSNTWGTGLLYEEKWPRKVYKLIASNEKVSGYFNISSVASPAFHQIITMFKYFKQFGNPNYIFFNMPKPSGFYAYNGKLDKITDAWWKIHPVIDVLSYHYYFMLNSYCESNDIKLITFTGYYSDTYTKEALSRSRIDQFKTFYKLDENEMKNFIKEYKDNNKHLEEAKYFDKARDGDHDGIAYHAYWAEFMYKKYLEL